MSCTNSSIDFNENESPRALTPVDQRLLEFESEWNNENYTWSLYEDQHEIIEANLPPPDYDNDRSMETTHRTLESKINLQDSLNVSNNDDNRNHLKRISTLTKQTPNDGWDYFYGRDEPSLYEREHNQNFARNNLECNNNNNNNDDYWNSDSIKKGVLEVKPSHDLHLTEIGSLDIYIGELHYISTQYLNLVGKTTNDIAISFKKDCRTWLWKNKHFATDSK